MSVLELFKEFILDLCVKKALVKKYFHLDKSRTTIHNYWKDPDDGHNHPMNYVINKPAQLRSENLVSIIQDLIINAGEILEIGCSADRNLNYL